MRKSNNTADDSDEMLKFTIDGLFTGKCEILVLEMQVCLNEENKSMSKFCEKQ